MSRYLSLLTLAFAFVATGCDSAPSASADWRSFCSGEFQIAGPASIGAGQTATYTVTSESGCTIYDVDWNAGFGTVVSSWGASAQIQAPTQQGPMWIEANVVYQGSHGYQAITEVSRGVTVTP